MTVTAPCAPVTGPTETITAYQYPGVTTTTDFYACVECDEVTVVPGKCSVGPVSVFNRLGSWDDWLSGWLFLGCYGYFVRCCGCAVDYYGECLRSD